MAKFAHSSEFDSLEQYASQSSFLKHPPGIFPAFISGRIFFTCSSSSGGIKSAAMAKSMHSSILSDEEQYASQDFLFAHPPGCFFPDLRALATFLASANSFSGIRPAFSAKSKHSPILSEDSQYDSQSVLFLHPPGILAPDFNASATFFASTSSLSLINPFWVANCKHESILSMLSQYVAHSDLLLHPPGPEPIFANFLASAASDADIIPFLSA